MEGSRRRECIPAHVGAPACCYSICLASPVPTRSTQDVDSNGNKFRIQVGQLHLASFPDMQAKRDKCLRSTFQSDPPQLTGSKPADVTVAAMAAVEVARVMAEAAQMVDEAWKELAGSGKAICFSWHLLVCCLGKAQSQKVAQSHRAPSEQEPVSSARGCPATRKFPKLQQLVPRKACGQQKGSPCPSDGISKFL